MFGTVVGDYTFTLLGHQALLGALALRGFVERSDSLLSSAIMLLKESLGASKIALETVRSMGLALGFTSFLS